MKELSFEEYVTELFKMVCKSQEDIEMEIKSPSLAILELYERYKSGIHEDFKADSNGKLVPFRNIPNQISFATVFGSSAEFWFVTADLRNYLFKNIFDFYNGNGSAYNTEINSILCPQIAKQFGIDSALYYVLKYYDQEGEEAEVMVTPDFKNSQDEELLSGYIFVSRNIGYYEEELNVNNILKGLDDNLRLRRIKSEDIESIKRDFLKQSLFHKLINDSDQNNYNWGIIKDCNHARLAPVYDYEYCFFNIKLNRTERYVGSSRKTDISSFIQEFHEDWFIDWIEESTQNFDFDKACADARLCTGMIIDDVTKQKYRLAFETKLAELNQAINLIKKKSLDESEDDQR